MWAHLSGGPCYSYRRKLSRAISWETSRRSPPEHWWRWESLWSYSVIHHHALSTPGARTIASHCLVPPWSCCRPPCCSFRQPSYPCSQVRSELSGVLFVIRVFFSQYDELIVLWLCSIWECGSLWWFSSLAEAEKDDPTIATRQAEIAARSATFKVGQYKASLFRPPSWKPSVLSKLSVSVKQSGSWRKNLPSRELIVVIDTIATKRPSLLASLWTRRQLLPNRLGNVCRSLLGSHHCGRSFRTNEQCMSFDTPLRSPSWVSFLVW